MKHMATLFGVLVFCFVFTVRVYSASRGFPQKNLARCAKRMQISYEDDDYIEEIMRESLTSKVKTSTYDNDHTKEITQDSPFSKDRILSAAWSIYKTFKILYLELDFENIDVDDKKRFEALFRIHNLPRYYATYFYEFNFQKDFDRLLKEKEEKFLSLDKRKMFNKFNKHVNNESKKIRGKQYPKDTCVENIFKKRSKNIIEQKIKEESNIQKLKDLLKISCPNEISCSNEIFVRRFTYIIKTIKIAFSTIPNDWSEDEKKQFCQKLDKCRRCSKSEDPYAKKEFGYFKKTLEDCIDQLEHEVLKCSLVNILKNDRRLSATCAYFFSIKYLYNYHMTECRNLIGISLEYLAKKVFEFDCNGACIGFSERINNLMEKLITESPQTKWVELLEENAKVLEKHLEIIRENILIWKNSDHYYRLNSYKTFRHEQMEFLIFYLKTQDRCTEEDLSSSFASIFGKLHVKYRTLTSLAQVLAKEPDIQNLSKGLACLYQQKKDFLKNPPKEYGFPSSIIGDDRQKLCEILFALLEMKKALNPLPASCPTKHDDAVDEFSPYSTDHYESCKS